MTVPRVLIVEDDRDIAALQRSLLADRADVLVLTDQFALALQPDTWVTIEIAVCDLMLPGLDGEDVCRFLRDEFPHIRRVICTAKPTSILPELTKLADVVLQKPFRPEDFVAAVLGEP